MSAASPASALPGPADRMTVMGVVNVTPDSFSDGGRYVDVDAAVAHGLRLRDEGADIVDVGGESTRPGAERVAADVEAARIVPVITELAHHGVVVSVDTYRSSVAEAALDAGAQIVNDVSGGLGDPRMVAVVRAVGCPWILMHWRGHSADMHQLANYADVVTEVVDELRARVDAALDVGVSPDRLIVDPGLGFAKTAAHNWMLLAQLERVMGLGFPVLVAASRKSFLGSVLAGPDGTLRAVDERENATTAITAYCAGAGVWGIRTHEVLAAVDAARTIAAIRAAGPREVPGEL